MIKSRPLIFIGSRYYMNDLAITAELMGLEVLGILDHQYHGNTDEISSIPVIGSDHWLLDPGNREAQIWKNTCDFFVATLDTGEQELNPAKNRTRLRQQRINMLEELALGTVNLIDPESRIVRDQRSRFSRISLGRGIYVAPFVDINHEVVIGDFSTFEHQSYIGHHITIGKNVTVLPTARICHCDIGDHAVIGYGSWTRHDERKSRYRIGARSTVWSHTCIDRSCPDDHVYTNVGKILRKRSV